jgi:hypothetical protein
MQLKLNKTLKGAFSILVFLGISCNEEIKEEKIEIEKTKIVFANNCEPNQIWIGEGTIAKNDVKKSGEYSSKMDASVEFGMGLRKRCDEISITPPKKVVAGVWIYCPDTANGGQIVVSVDDEKGNVYWSGFPINKSVKKSNEWVYVENTIEFPLTLNAKNFISVYAWNAKKQLFYLDDWKIEFSN